MQKSYSEVHRRATQANRNVRHKSLQSAYHNTMSNNDVTQAVSGYKTTSPFHGNAHCVQNVYDSLQRACTGRSGGGSGPAELSAELRK